MRTLYIALLSIVSVTMATSQVTYHTKLETPVARMRSVDLRTLPEPTAYVDYRKGPEPGGDAYHAMLQEQKKKAMVLHPEKPGTAIHTRSLVEPPQLVRSFSGNGQQGIPLDNHLAVNKQDQVISVVNVHMIVTGPTGVWQGQYSLDAFWSEIGETESYFDPRVIYDPAEDRFILTMMQDFDCDGSNIVFAFSATNDPNGLWHMYQFEGCPNGNATFADYPMIALTQDEIFFTYNAVYQDSSWQTGFNETFVYQINKFNGYAGEDLTWRSWSDIRTDGRLLRYMCPVKSGDEFLDTDLYLLSDRSFDIENDTFFLIHINGNLDNPDLELTAQPLVSDKTYGVPPNARQPMDFLQTNDARVLDAFVEEDHIQFVNSTMDPNTGRSAVYHGVITDLSTSPVLSAEYLHNGTEHYAYPGIAYTGTLPGDRDAIIVASHSSADRFPGYSALYYNEGYSDWVTVKEGTRNIDMFKVNNPFGVDPTLERWGDYSGIQRQWNEIGTVYTASSYGKPGSINDAWIGYLKRLEGDPTSSEEIFSREQITAYPNPASNWFTVHVDIPKNGRQFRADLFDARGELISVVHQTTLTQEGALDFHYNATALPSGMYMLRITIDDHEQAAKQVVIE